MYMRRCSTEVAIESSLEAKRRKMDRCLKQLNNEEINRMRQGAKLKPKPREGTTPKGLNKKESCCFIYLKQEKKKERKKEDQPLSPE